MYSLHNKDILIKVRFRVKPKRGISLATSVVIAVIASLVVGVVAITEFPNGIITTTVTQTTGATSFSSSSGVTTTSSSESIGTCPGTGSNAADAYTSDCKLGITLGLETNPVHFTGQNGTFSVYLSNDNASSRNITYTGAPSLPHGLDLTSAVDYDYVLPSQTSCGTSAPTYDPVFMMVYNGTGSPLQLSDSPPNETACVSTSNNYYHFDSLETINATTTLGGYWTSTDSSEPWINAVYHGFAPGNYTVIAFDPWQQIVELNFSIVTSA